MYKSHKVKLHCVNLRGIYPMHTGKVCCRLAKTTITCGICKVVHLSGPAEGTYNPCDYTGRKFFLNFRGGIVHK